MRPRSVYFYVILGSFDDKILKSSFIEFVSDNLIKEVGEKGSKEGFAKNNLDSKPIIEYFETFLKVKYGIEHPKTNIRLDGSTETYHSSYDCNIIFDYSSKLIGLFSHKESFINSLSTKITNYFAVPNGFTINRIQFEPDLLSWIVENYRQYSTIIINARRIKIKKDNEYSTIYHDENILSSTLYASSKSDSVWEYDFIECDCKIQSQMYQFFNFRLYSNGKFTIYHDQPYQIGKVLIKEINKLKSKYEEVSK